VKILKKLYYKIANTLINQISALLQQQLLPIRISINEIENKLSNFEESIRENTLVIQKNSDSIHKLFKDIEIQIFNHTEQLLNHTEQLNKLLTDCDIKNNTIISELEATRERTSNLSKQITKTEISIRNHTQQKLEGYYSRITGVEIFEDALSTNAEFKMFDYISIDNVISFVDQDSDSTSIVSLWCDLYKKYFNDVNFIEPMSIGGLLSLNEYNYKKGVVLCYPTALSKVLKNQTKVIITNTQLSSYLVNNNEIIEAMSEKITGALILPFIIRTPPLVVNWDYGFSAVERNEQNIFRWCEGEAREASITIYNNSNKSIDRLLSWTSYALSTENSILQVTGCGLNKHFNLTEETTFLEKISIQPGVNKLHFSYLGTTIQPEAGARLLNFNIINLKISSIENENFLDGLEIYKNESISFNHYINDYQIRKILHLNGFFEVSGQAFSNSGNFEVALPTTRYFHDTNSYYNLNNDDTDPLNDAYQNDMEELLVIYTANRCGRRGIDHEINIK
jgi:hypothetical protein